MKWELVERQPTGLVDMNGAEVFAGDIVQDVLGEMKDVIVRETDGEKVSWIQCHYSSNLKYKVGDKWFVKSSSIPNGRFLRRVVRVGSVFDLEAQQ